MREPIEIRPMLLADLDEIVELQKACFPAPFPEELLWQRSHLERHLAIFAEGQLVAEREGVILASASTLIINEENWQSHADWETTVGGHNLNQHDANGSTLYGVDISVHPLARGQGIGRLIYAARFELVRALNLDRYGTACRIPDYSAWAEKTGGSPTAYVGAVFTRGASDRTLSPLLGFGLSLVGVIESYMDDEESGHAAALLEWTP